MIKINKNSISKKLDDLLNKSEYKKKIQEAKNEKLDKILLGSISFNKNGAKVFSAQELAEKFIDILKEEISRSVGSDFSSGQIGESIAGELSRLHYGTPIKVQEGVYQVDIYFDLNKHRDSLYSSKYSGINNIVELLDKGYNANKSVYGKWHGNTIASLANRDGAGFIDSAIEQFTNKYHGRSNAVSITYTPNTPDMY